MKSSKSSSRGTISSRPRKSKLDKAIDNIKKVVNGSNLTVEDMLTILSNLSYHTGASLTKDKRLLNDISYLELTHLKKPTLATALLLQSAYMELWKTQYNKDTNF